MLSCCAHTPLLPPILAGWVGIIGVGCMLEQPALMPSMLRSPDPSRRAVGFPSSTLSDYGKDNFSISHGNCINMLAT
jgi:hypothetical protein